MLIVCEKGREAELEEIFVKWDLNAVQIGTVTGDDRVRVFWHGTEVANVPAEHLVLGGGAPVYIREAQRPAYLDATMTFDPLSLDDISPEDGSNILVRLLGSPNIASKAWVFEQYDTMVRTNTVAGPGPTDAGVVRVKDTEKALAVKTDCNGRFVHLNPRKGGQMAVAEAARNVVCTGAQPLAITNCLNFGNPYKPEMYWVFKEAVSGMGDACRAFETPVTGGNVSFYNESPEAAVYPTPTIGMLGLIEDVDRHTTTASFKNAGDLIYLLTPAQWQHRNDTCGSEYLAEIRGQVAGDAPHLELSEEVAVQEAMLKLIRAGLIESAHDVSDGGLAVCLAESAIFSAGLGASAAMIGDEDLRLDALLFGEAQSRIVFTIAPEKRDLLESMVRSLDVQAQHIGEVSERLVEISWNGTKLISVARDVLEKAYEECIPKYLNA
jgi:phosphoribosylformylglycinamidine synthase